MLYKLYVRLVINMHKNIITVVGMTILFLGTCITPTYAIDNPIKPISSGNTLYVGGSGEGNYTSIQDAIDNASIGDTVFVYDDSSPYYEELQINKTINLIGEDKHTTVIDAQHEDDTVNISVADNCLVSGFTIQNCHWSGTEYSHAVVSIIRSDYVIIKDNILTIGDTSAIDWTCAVELDNCTYCTIQDNIMSEDDYKKRTVGVSLHEGSSYNTISGNDISTYTIGVETFVLNYNLFDSNNYNIISGNHIHHNLIGIQILGDTNNEILNNTIEYNEAEGIRNAEAHNTTISGNIISYNGIGREFDCGIKLTFETKNNYISDNVISNNNPTGIYMLTGVRNVVTRNNIVDNWGKSGTPERWWGNAFFNYELSQWRLFRLNCWRRNYWSGHSGILPKAIHGVYWLIFEIPWFEFDWLPAKKPYDI